MEKIEIRLLQLRKLIDEVENEANLTVDEIDTTEVKEEEALGEYDSDVKQYSEQAKMIRGYLKQVVLFRYFEKWRIKQESKLIYNNCCYITSQEEDDTYNEVSNYQYHNRETLEYQYQNICKIIETSNKRKQKCFSRISNNWDLQDDENRLDNKDVDNKIEDNNKSVNKCKSNEEETEEEESYIEFSSDFTLSSPYCNEKSNTNFSIDNQKQKFGNGDSIITKKIRFIDDKDQYKKMFKGNSAIKSIRFTSDSEDEIYDDYKKNMMKDNNKLDDEIPIEKRKEISKDDSIIKDIKFSSDSDDEVTIEKSKEISKDDIKFSSDNNDEVTIERSKEISKDEIKFSSDSNDEVTIEKSKEISKDDNKFSSDSDDEITIEKNKEIFKDDNKISSDSDDEITIEKNKEISKDDNKFSDKVLTDINDNQSNEMPIIKISEQNGSKQIGENQNNEINENAKNEKISIENLIKNQIQKNKEQKEREPEPALSPSLQLSEVDDISDPYNSLPIYSDEIDPDDLEYIENLSSTQISEILKDVK